MGRRWWWKLSSALGNIPYFAPAGRLDSKQRETGLGAGASVKRQQHTGNWTGDHVVFHVDRNQICELPAYEINVKTAKSMGIPNLRVIWESWAWG